MLSLSQRLILGCALLLAIVLTLGLSTRNALRHLSALDAQAREQDLTLHDAGPDRRAVLEAATQEKEVVVIHNAMAAGAVAFLAALAIVVAMVPAVLKPIRRTAQNARAIAQGDLQQRIEWRSRDDLGAIGVEVNRMAVRLRDLLETESGRKQMEHQLSDAVLQSIFEPVIVTDAKGNVLKLNRASADLLGDAATDRMALTNTPGGEKILIAVRDAVSMQRPIANEGDASILPMHIGKAQRSYRLRTTPMRDADGKLLGAVTVLEDVTEMQDIDRFKTRFLSVASQKMRDPLQKLRLGIYTLAKGFGGELRPLQRDLLQGAEQEAEQLNDLMSDLFEVAELDVGNRQLKMERLKPIDVLEDAYNRIYEEAKEKNIEIEIKTFADLSHVSADKRALRSVLDNLLTNAVRYTPSGGQIVLGAEELKDTIQFYVRDTGRGIETERLPGIFGRFGANQEGSGTGLGLSLARRLVEALGGQISVESRLGNGTTFRFSLPVATITATRHPVEIG